MKLTSIIGKRQLKVVILLLITYIAIQVQGLRAQDYGYGFPYDTLGADSFSIALHNLRKQWCKPVPATHCCEAYVTLIACNKTAGIGNEMAVCSPHLNVYNQCMNQLIAKCSREFPGSMLAWDNKSHRSICRHPEGILPNSNYVIDDSVFGSWKFGRSRQDGKPVDIHLCDLDLTDNSDSNKGFKIRSCHRNETYWEFEEPNTIVFKHESGEITTRFHRIQHNYWEGTFIPPRD